MFSSPRMSDQGWPRYRVIVALILLLTSTLVSGQDLFSYVDLQEQQIRSQGEQAVLDLIQPTLIRAEVIERALAARELVLDAGFLARAVAGSEVNVRGRQNGS